MWDYLTFPPPSSVLLLGHDTYMGVVPIKGFSPKFPEGICPRSQSTSLDILHSAPWPEHSAGAIQKLYGK